MSQPVGLSSWILADGNYPHFSRGDRTSFALAFSPAVSPIGTPSDWIVIDPRDADRSSMRHIEGARYLVTAVVTDVVNNDDDWWVIDAGILMYRSRKPPQGIKPGSWVRGHFYVGIDPFDYRERYSRHHAAPALIYDWELTKIELETTPMVGSGQMRMRDPSRRSWREVDNTEALSGAFPDEYILHCQRLDTPPRR